MNKSSAAFQKPKISSLEKNTYSDGILKENPSNLNNNTDNLINEEMKKINIKNKPKWAMTKDEAENLDYEKYIKDLEIREALGLIKMKIEQKEGEENEQHQVNNEFIDENKNEILNEELILPVISSSKPLEHENDWNNSVKVGENALKIDEKLKKTVADEVLKTNPVFYIYLFFIGIKTNSLNSVY